MPLSSRRPILVTVLLALASCGENPVDTTVAPTFAILDGAGDGNEHFFFLPPIAPEPTPNGDFDATLSPEVEICEPASCGTAPIAVFTTTTGPGSETVRVDEGEEHYSVSWHTRDFGLEAGTVYRVVVRAEGVALGWADVAVVATGRELLTIDTDEFFGLVNGRTLAIRFRIEEGAIGAVGGIVDSGGGTLTLAEGQVILDFPAGAVSDPVRITAEPASDLPAEPTPVAGTAFDFGPDGIVFDERPTLTVGYDAANLPPGVDEAELRLHKLVDGSYVQVDAGSVDVVNKTVSGLIDGFSVFVVLSRLFPGSPEDVQGPDVQGVEVFDPATGVFGSAVTLQTSTADATLRTRVDATDDISGVSLIQVDYVSPSGRQIRFPCWPFPTDPPISGSDTNGTWECESTWPRYAEAGVWRPNILFVSDAVGNHTSFFDTPRGFCDSFDPDGPCFTGMPEITVVSDPDDTSPPFLHSLDVSLDTQPRDFGSVVSVDASSAAQGVVFRFHATDDLSGIEPRSRPHERFLLTFTGPSGQSQQGTFCTLAAGTDLDAFWECPMTVPFLAEPGPWQLTRLQVPDRVGNGGRSELSYFTPDGTGRLCNPDGNCVAAPTVEVTGIGDSEAPFLQSVTVDVSGASVTTTVAATDDLIGVNEVVVQYNSATTQQSALCFGSLTSGDVNDGTWACSITLQEFSALGDWNLSFLTLVDAASNRRQYRRRDGDGFLCYGFGSDEVCEDFGDLVIVIQ